MTKNLLLLLFCLFSFSAIHADDNGSCGDNLTWKFTSSDRTLTISGTGNMTNFVDNRYVPWVSLRDEITKVVIKDGVTNIGDYAFWNCRPLSSVEIPNSVTSIGEYAFYGCSGLTSITIPNSVTSIEAFAFWN